MMVLRIVLRTLDRFSSRSMEVAAAGMEVRSLKLPNPY